MSLLAGACLAAASCSDSDEDTKLPSPNFPEAVSATIEAGGTYTLEIEPNQNWEVSVPTATAAWFWIQDETQKVWTLRGGAGWSPALWNGALFAMRIGARGQSMVNLKTDNTGQNPSAETERLSVEDILNGGANDYNPAAHLSVGTSSAPLDDTRTRFNRSHMASLNNLRKLSEDYQLSSSLTWGYDRLASDRAK